MDETFKLKTYSEIFSISLDKESKHLKEVKAVICDGVVVRRSHMRNYGRSVKGGKSLMDLFADNVRSSNALLARLQKDNIYSKK